MWHINLENVSNLVTHTLTQPNCENVSNMKPSPVLPSLSTTFCPLLMLLTYASMIPQVYL